MKYHLHSVESDIYEDSYAEGELDAIGCGQPYEKICVDFNSMEEVIAYIDKYHNLGTDLNNYDIENGRISTSRQCANHADEQNGGWMDPTPEEEVEWQAGKLKLYTEHYRFEFSVDAEAELREIADELASKLESQVVRHLTKRCTNHALPAAYAQLLERYTKLKENSMQNKKPTIGQMNAAIVNRSDNYRPTPEQAIRAIVARIDGDFDNPELLAFGPLMTNAMSDVQGIAAAAMLGIQHMEKFYAET